MQEGSSGLEVAIWHRCLLGDGCWEWQQARSKNGYGAAYYKGKLWGAHRLAYLLWYGSIDPALQVLHSCDNPPCIRPDHLSQGTNGDNQRQAVSRGRHSMTRKTHCLRGHPLPDPNKYGRRQCQICVGLRRRGMLDNGAV